MKNQVERNTWGDEQDSVEQETGKQHRLGIGIKALILVAMLSAAYVTWGLLKVRTDVATSESRKQTAVRAKMESLLLSFRFDMPSETTLPSPAILNRDGKVAYSWRVLFCYNHLDVAEGHWKKHGSHYSDSWDKECPSSYQLPRTKQGNERCTCIAMIVGPGTIFEEKPTMRHDWLFGPKRPGEKIAIIMELPESDLNWVEPVDVDVVAAVRLIQESKLEGGTFVGFSDGSVEQVPADTPDADIRKLFLVKS